VNDLAAAASISGPIRPKTADGLQTLRSGLELARASQLTMLRLQLALHRSNRRTAMQALDTLLDIDAEMEDLAATLGNVPARLANDADLSGFIGLQRAAIAAEKHALTGGDWRNEAGSVLSAEPLFPEDEAESDDRAHGKRWPNVLAATIITVIVACGVMAYLWPTLPAAVSRMIPLMQRL
jgi:hypothetical protein